MYIFGSTDDCCFVEAKLSRGVRGIRLSFSGGGIYDGFGEDTVVVGVSFNQREKVAVLPCFNNKNYIYAFGHDASASTVDISVIASVCPGSPALQQGADLYARNRISRGSIATISYGTLPIRGILLGMSSSTADPKLNLQSITYHFLLIKCIGDK